jgi:two-component system CheB/CheR fusion protein
MQNYLQTGVRRIIGIGREVTGQRRDGSIFPIHLSVSEIQLGATRLFTGIIHDLTRQRALESQILEASTNEQRRIGQDLHDGLCQELVALGFSAQAIAETLRRKDLPEAKAADRLGTAIREITVQARQLSHGLNPIDVKAGGLASALKHLAGRVSETFRIRCTFQQQKQTAVTNDLVATHLYRIAQEAISNAVRHGRADRVDIRLTRKADYLVLSVRDNGIGFKRARADAEATGEAKPGVDGGIGLQTMAYRARVIGGELRVEPHAKAGTVVTCHLYAGHAPGGNGPP